ncbi:MAG: VCBS repeat-containing protein [Thermoanaerobaculia bacterium]|nr:VCBS repeat-containing protein [Thermoanaerobaculia bacterium]
MKLRRLAKVSLVLLLVVAAVVAFIAHRSNRWSRQHAEFSAAGKTINDFLKDYASAVASGDPARVLEHYSEDFATPQGRAWRLQATGLGVSGDVEGAGIEYRPLETGSFGPPDRSGLTVRWAEYFEGLAAIDSVQCKINLIEEIDPERSATLTVNFSLRGSERGGRLVEDRFTFRWWIVRNSADGAPWRVVREDLDADSEQRRLSGSGNAFVRLDLAAAGIDYVHRRNPAVDPTRAAMRFGVVEHAAGGVAAADYDDDGRVDLFFADGVASRLFRNVTPPGDESPVFRDVTTTAGLGGLDQAHCGLFADFDDDGDRDLAVTRYLVPNKLYCNDGNGRYSDCTEGSGLDIQVPSVSSTVLDYDADGALDLYLAVNGNAFEACPDIPFYATNGQPNRLFRNLGGGRFEDVTESAGVGGSGWSLAVAAADANQDGRPDLMVANDFGRKTLYVNEGEGRFSEVAKEAGVLDFSGGMGLAFGDVDGDGMPDVYTSNINSNQRWFGEDLTIKQYVRNVLGTRYLWRDLPTFWEVFRLLGDQWPELGKMVGEGNSLFLNRGDGTYREVNGSHTRRAGWSWGVGFVDFDNDTDLDLFAANGWISGKNRDDL